MLKPSRYSDPHTSQSRWRTPLHSRGALLVSLFLLPLIGLFLYARSAWLLVFYRLVVDGGTALLWIAAATGLGMLICRRLRLWTESTPVALRLASWAATGLGILSLAILGLGLAGFLNTATAWTLVGLGLAAGIVAVYGWRRESEAGAFKRWLIASAGWEWLALLATPFLALALTAALVPPGLLWSPDEPNGYDVVEYHLQAPREWYEAHRIVPLHHNVYSYFPFNVEMHYLLAMHLRGGPWAGMYLSQFMHLTLMILVVVAVYGFSRNAAGAAGAMIAAMSLLTVPWLTQLAGIAYDEGGFLLFGTLSIGWAMIATIDSKHRLIRYAFAGAMGGLAAGSKLTGVPEILLAVPIVCAGAALWKVLSRREHELSPWIGIAIYCMAGTLTFSPWLIRNMRWAGNPVFPELMPLLGSNDFTPVQVQRWELAHQPPPAQRPISARVATIWREVFLGWQFGYLLLPMGLIAFALSIRRPTAWWILGLLLTTAIFWLFFTHLQARFFILAAPLAACLVAQINWRQKSFIGVAIVAVFAIIAWVQLNSRLCKKLYANGGSSGIVQLLGVDDLTWMLQLPPLDGVPPDAPLCLVGDAKAFWYSIPMSRLRYRTVFDVGNDAPDIVDAWIGPGGKPGEIILVDPQELKRLNKSYFGLPPLPDRVKETDHRYLQQ